MAWTAKQIESQIVANDREIEDIERKLKHQPGSPERSRLQNRLEMVERAQDNWRTEYFKLTGVRYGKTTVEHVKPRWRPDTGNPNQLLTFDQSDPNYIDNVVAGHYDVLTGKFTVEHADGSVIELDYQQILRDIQPAPGGAPNLPPGLKLPPGYSIDPDKGVTVGGVLAYRRDPKDNKIYPSRFNATTAPNIIAMVQATEAQRPTAELSLEMADQLLHMGLIGGQPTQLFPGGSALRLTTKRLTREVENTGLELTTRETQILTIRQTLRELGQSMIRKVRGSGKPVIVNWGGTGELADAINLNPNRVAPRQGIPNLIKTGAERTGELFGESSLDGIVSNRLPPNTINWAKALPGAKQALRPGTRIIIRFQGTGKDAEVIVPLLEELGFKNIKNWSGTVIEAVR